MDIEDQKLACMPRWHLTPSICKTHCKIVLQRHICTACASLCRHNFVCINGRCSHICTCLHCVLSAVLGNASHPTPTPPATDMSRFMGMAASDMSVYPFPPSLMGPYALAMSPATPAAETSSAHSPTTAANTNPTSSTDDQHDAGSLQHRLVDQARHLSACCRGPLPPSPDYEPGASTRSSGPARPAELAHPYSKPEYAPTRRVCAQLF